MGEEEEQIGDNSAVNLMPILAGDLSEALSKPKLTEFGDINEDWIQPRFDRLDPDRLPFLWKEMEKGQRGRLQPACRRLHHHAQRRYHASIPRPVSLPLAGVQVWLQEASHYSLLQAFLQLYLLCESTRLQELQSQSYDPKFCDNDRWLQEEFVDLWRQFALRYRDKCHFGFTFIARSAKSEKISSLTHDTQYLLELADEKVYSMLEDMVLNDALNDTVLVLMGDHGQRMTAIQYTYRFFFLRLKSSSGRIEERMPFFSVRMPDWFRKEFPEEFVNLERNQWKFTR